MTDIASSPTPATSLPELSGRMADDLAHLDAELGEVDLLVAQAKTEAARHESRRVAAAEKLATAIVDRDVGRRARSTRPSRRTSTPSSSS